MPLTDQVKNLTRKLVEDKPDQAALSRMVRKSTVTRLHFKDDGIIPNHPRWPLLVYRRAVMLARGYDPAVSIDALFSANGWGRSWRDSVYDFLHYHSQIHEVLGVAKGSAVVEFGGIKGKRITVHAGDVAILPAGTGHRLIEASKDFLIVGAYPADGTYDECTDTRDAVGARKRIAKTKRPKSDPIYGKRGGLMRSWRKRHN
ncbi:MAG: cupin domain-containing protein [Bradyrhizobium sp.]|uniref:cupin domain-containing protein n=1 Tax=Bradyrhizobium sp. TaxID=376 RepID=UPI0029A83983|nr:cupin domain-containing protein [Bradyrhizobium sp.]MDX3969113.1 cupin domain-containing protein [Bradyrhizobium sp.]